jgi:hypothetical protein
MVAIGAHPESIAYRLRQTARSLRADMPEERDELVARLLSPAQEAIFRTLPRVDQAHSIRLVLSLMRDGEPSRDLLIAGLLHDMAKVQPSGRVHLHDRALRVIFAKFAPRLLGRLAALPAARWRLGIALAVHHPELGARQARELGCSPRACWLIAHHADRHPPEDLELHRLIAADHLAG